MASMPLDTVLDPLTMNIRRQWASIASHIQELPSSELKSQEELVLILTHVLYDPRYTLLIAEKFRPILMILCAHWLDYGGEEDAKLATLALLVNPHEELFPILSAFLRISSFSKGLVTDLSSSTPTSQLHLRLLAYYRILVACPHITDSLGWSPEFLSHLMTPPHSDPGVRWLAVRCYALHMRMTERERDDLQSRIVGITGEVDVPIQYGLTIGGERQFLDGWLLPALEEMRIQDSRQAMLAEHDFYDKETSTCLNLEHITHRIVDVHGILLMRSYFPAPSPSKLVSTGSTVSALRELAIRTSLKLPTLISSPPSTGKTLLLDHLASLLHSDRPNQVVTLHLSDTSLDARSLMGSYVSSTRRSGTFEWQEGVVVRAMKYGLWLVLKDIDRASSDVLGILLPLIESLAAHKHIGASASLEVPGHGRVDGMESFMIFATRSVVPIAGGRLPPPTFLGSNKFSCVEVSAPTHEDMVIIINSQCPKLGRCGTRALINAWEAVRALGPPPGGRVAGIRDLETWCKRVESLLRKFTEPDAEMACEETLLDHIYPHVSLREDIFLEARDVFFGAGAFSESTQAHLMSVRYIFAQHLGLSPERADWVLNGRVPQMSVEKDENGRTSALQIGNTRLSALRIDRHLMASPQRPFAMHRSALLLTERIATSVSLSEPVLLVGETGTGKTTLVSHISLLLNRKLVSLNLSHQSESSDLVGGFKPVDTRVPASELQRRFTHLFSRTFSRRKNSKFENAVRKAVNEGKWKRAVALWNESARLALEKIRERSEENFVPRQENDDAFEDPRGVHATYAPRKRRKVADEADTVQESDWLVFEGDVHEFDIQHVQGKGKFAFSFVEGPLIEALRNGYWVLLDEINLASPETLECIAAILQGPTASLVLTEQGSFTPVLRHPEFRLFACMNPATDVGKKDLSFNIRSRFTEIHVPPPDSDREALLAIIQQYIGHCALADKRAMLDVAEFYLDAKRLAERRELADGSNHRPHFSMRSLTRALTFTSDTVLTFGLRRALWEGCLMAFCMALDEKSIVLMKNLAEKHLLAGVKNVRAMISQIPVVPENGQGGNFERIGPFWLERGSLQPEPVSEYILTPSVQSKLVDLARTILTRRFPVLIEGPTSTGKTSAVEYLARKTGHRFVRVNNHEHTDIQEYLGTYISDAETGKLVFQDGILVRALRNGDWIVLDELNLAPTDVLEALNRLLDDNRELLVPETQEVIKPHPHFVLFATQNPPGLYSGRKVLSRAFRNRFLEVHFDDVPQSELRTILSERCRIPDSYAQRIVGVFQELSKRRQAGRVFENKHGFATLRDLFRWAGREAVNTQQLAQNGYMLLAERARRPDDKAIVKEVIETVMKENIDPDAIYDVQCPGNHIASRLGVPLPSSSSVIWTSSMKRLFVLVATALRFNEPVLLVGQTGSGKTSVCQLFAESAQKQLVSLNCHRSTETSDLIGGQRPLRNRSFIQSQLIEEAREVLCTRENVASTTECAHDIEGILSLVKKCLKVSTLSPALESNLRKLKLSLQQSTSLFEWHDGPLVRAMRSGDVFLLDEISLADDSVLERLNSVLEPARNLILAERGGFDVEHAQVIADPGFKLLATMNPGGDYGKKELSPALRNRFTEIWVPQIVTSSDRQMIIDDSWRHDTLKRYTSNVLMFTEWLATAIGEPSSVSLRDLLTWVEFSNAVCDSDPKFPLDILFHHAAHLVFLDGLESSPYTSGLPTASLHDLRTRGIVKLDQIVPLSELLGEAFDGKFRRTSNSVYFGVFGIHQGPHKSIVSDFSLRAPTTLENIRRLVRACQISKPILLEGSPGVGKTSLVSALSDVSGHRLYRINLSDQTDLMDLFGSDLPVDGGKAGEFAWKDAQFLRAMQDGDWVLLDEMNLASQSVLEGLNSVLDHRGTVFIPELARSFTKHPRFRIFAAQNPLYQGGGRKGLPRSFLDRFTKVHIKALSPVDFLLICRTLFPTLPADHLQLMILFNARLHEETMVKCSFGREGGPWEFNLRDIIRWATLLAFPSPLSVVPHPSVHLDTVYLQRFRTEDDRRRAVDLFCQVFSLPQMDIPSPRVSPTPSFVQLGSALLPRGDYGAVSNSIQLQHRLRSFACAGECIHRAWLTIISGPAGGGKTHFVRYLATAANRRLHEFSMSSGVDTSDLLGSFEQSTNGKLDDARFEWMDGPLVQAVKSGHWLVLDNANLCSPSVLDRLNSLCETNGSLILTERGHVHGHVVTLKPHPNFRLFLTLDPRNGQLSRAMRNRGIEICLLAAPASLQDQLRIQSTIRTPLLSISSTGHIQTDNLVTQFELLRRCNSQSSWRDQPAVLCAVPGGNLCNDSATSTALDLRAFARLESSENARVSAYAHVLLSLRLISPSQWPILRRMVLASDRDFDEIRTHILHVLSGAPQSSIWTLRRTLVEKVSEARGVPLNFILNQPFDLSMNANVLAEGLPNHDDLTIQQRTLSGALELLVHVYFSDHRESSESTLMHSVFSQSRMLETGDKKATSPTPGVASIFPLYSSIMALAHNVIKELEFDNSGKQLPLVEEVKHLVDIAEHLRRCSSGTQYDFTCSRVICGWLREAVAINSPLHLSPIISNLETMENDVSLTCGHGMQQIWRNLVVTGLSSNIISEVTRLDHLGVNLDPKQPSYYDLRADALRAIALLTLKISSSTGDQKSVMEVWNNICRLIAEAVICPDTESTYSPQMAIAELDFLSEIFNANDHRGCLRSGYSLIQLTSRTPHASLARVAKVQHYLWTLETLGAHPKDQLATLTSLLHGRLSALNDLGGYGRTYGAITGPGTLLEPVLLQHTVAICHHERALENLESHENSLSLAARMAENHCQESTKDRVLQIIDIWKGVILIIASCFKETFSPEAMQAVAQAAYPHNSSHTCSNLIELVSRTAHPQLSRIVLDRLLPVSRRLDRCRTEFDKISCTGMAWVAVGLTLLEIYVPNVPLDPVAAQRCAVEFWERRKVEILAQVKVHTAAEQMTTGNNTNPIIATLRSRLDTVQVNLQNFSECPISREVNVNSLHALHGEVGQFLRDVINSAKFEAIIRDLEIGREDAHARALMVQNTISTFIMRLESAYPQLEDMTQPICMALSQLVFGLHLLLHGLRRYSANVRLLEHFRPLVAFPTVVTMDLIQKQHDFQETHSTEQLLLSLSAVAYDMQLQGTSMAQFVFLDAINNQLMKLWLQDRDQEDTELRESLSLYRHKNLDHSMQAEDELEEQEFREIFPSFEGLDASESRSTLSRPVEFSPGRRVSDKDCGKVYRIHLWINEHPCSRHLDELNDEFHELRNYSVCKDLDSNSSWFPQTLDMESLPYRILLLSNAMKELRSHHRPIGRGIYNFYHDSNIPEARKALSVVRSIQERLHQLLKDWPDQMVLHHIIARCEAVVKLDLRSPVAKILTALEQLLLQMEDWDIYSNRENDLKPQQSMLSGLIVQWRRLELSCWSQLLEAQSVSFSDGTAEWWFRLYELTIQGTLAAAAEGTGSLDAYLSNMTHLTRKFISQGPLGQFNARMQLLKSFGLYARKLSSVKSGLGCEALARTGRILRNLHSFNDQFNDAVSRSLAEKRGTLEKELLDLVRLASWKDVNVHALRQSAQRTHRQLYKSIRRFRELLREPVAPFISYKTSQAESRERFTKCWKPDFITLVNFSPADFPVIHASNSNEVAPHLLDLPRTFSKYRDLLASHGQPMVNAISSNHVEDLAVKIAETTAWLSRQTDVAGNDMRLHKTILMQKRKAWTDLLKELKRAGLSSRLKPEILERQRSETWLMDRLDLVLPEDAVFADVALRGEEYFNHLVAFMPELRGSLSSHHGDLSTRELERAVTFVESSFSLALDSRERFATDCLLYRDATRVAQRLKQLSEAQGAISISCDIAPRLKLCCQLEDVLNELSRRCIDFPILGSTSTISSVTVESISAHLRMIHDWRLSLSVVQSNVGLTHKGLMSSEEQLLLNESRASILSTRAALASWMSQEPRIQHLCSPILTWLESAIINDELGTMEENLNEGPPNGHLINRLLIIVQDIIASDIPSDPPDVDQSPDHYASKSEKINSDVSRLFGLKAVTQELSSFVDELAISSPAKRLEKIAVVIPFLETYLALIHNHLLAAGQLFKAFAKFSYVLCSVVHSLSTQGFCKPSEMDESSEKHEPDGIDMAQDGTGIGQGTGAEDISNQVKDESQVEGLRGEEASEAQQGNDGKEEDGIEMEDNFEGEMGEFENNKPEGSSDSESLPDIDEQVGGIDRSDPDAVDEKLWGDNGGEETPEGQTSGNGVKNSTEDSDVVAKEAHEAGRKDERNDQEKEPMQSEQSFDGSQQGVEEIAEEENPISAGRQMDEHVAEGDTLDLPDDLNLAEADEQEEDLKIDDDIMGEGGLEESNLEEGAEEPTHDDIESLQAKNQNEVSKEDDVTLSPPQRDESSGGQIPEKTSSQSNASLSINETGDGGEQNTATYDADFSTETKTQDFESIVEGTVVGDENAALQGVQSGNNRLSAADPPQAGNFINFASNDAFGANTEQFSAAPNPLRMLGDIVKELQRRLEPIGEATAPEAAAPKTTMHEAAPVKDDSMSQVEYLQEGMEEAEELQALGPATGDQIMKLSELKIRDDRPASNARDNIDVEGPDIDPQDTISRELPPIDVKSRGISLPDDMDDAVTHWEVSSDHPDRSLFKDSPNAASIGATDIDMDNSSFEDSVQSAVKKWQDTGHSDLHAAEIWRLYDTLTEELSHSLCEQLRLILEPTLATRLRGDYRTGKRLNMKKVIPYIASEYTKDKIWLRRTRPSQREYQILIALDDSRSMAESRSVHLAYETLALVSKALNRLESGEVAIARFGESVEIVHGFEEGMVGDREGAKVMQRFRFEQRKTDVLGLVETSLSFLTQARERRSMGGPSSEAADLWQLEIIISDGICQDHDKLRSALRRAEEHRIMIVFIVVDSLHIHHGPLSSDNPVDPPTSQSSILHMKQVSYKDIGEGRMDLQMERYLDSFPFQYYVILRSVEALPDVLSGTLKQFFERISEE